MFTKKKLVSHSQQNRYKTVIDWDAVWGTVLIIGIVLIILNNI